MLEVEVIIKVPFYDLDPMAVVWHGNYIKYFEVARCELLEKINYNYEQMAESNYSWPVVRLNVKYVKPVTFGAEIVVKAKLVEYENRLKIEYLITDRKTGAKLTKAYTIQVAVDTKTMETRFVSPDILFKKLGVMS